MQEKDFLKKTEAKAKINWFLDILGQREDGYHELSTLMQKVSLADQMTLAAEGFTEQEEKQLREEGFSTGVFAAGESRLFLAVKSQEQLAADEHNSCVKALRVLHGLAGEKQKALLAGRDFAVCIDKHIPVQGGLGGGSSDAACALRYFADFLEEGGEALSEAILFRAAEKVGADVPFCLDPRPLLHCGGIGEVFTEVPEPRAPLHLLLLLPDLKVSTAEAFGAYDAMMRQERARMPQSYAEEFAAALAEGKYSDLKKWGYNSFLALHQKKTPELQVCRDILYEAGALYASLSGSGPSFFALFAGERERKEGEAFLKKRLAELKFRASVLPADAG